MKGVFLRYGLACATVAVAFGLRKLLEGVTGTGAPFVLFFGAVLLTNLLAGPGPAIVAGLASTLLGAHAFVVTAGHLPSQAAWQSALFAFDCALATYLSLVMTRARETASRSEAHVRSLVELAPDAFFLADLDARLVDVNAAACQLLGYEREELVGKTIFDIIPAEDAERLNTVRGELLVPGNVSRAEWTQKRHDGTSVPVEVSSNILPDGRWQAFVRDISERKRADDERQLFVSLVENSSDFIGIADPQGKPVYVNPAGRRMVGLPLDYPIGETQIPEYYPPAERSFATDVIVRSMLERGHWTGETYFRHWQTNEAIPVSDEHFVIRDRAGTRTIGLGTVTRDISAARRIAREREELLAREKAARQEAETTSARLRESEERFRLTIDGAPIGMALVALNGRFVRVNQALCQIVGYSAEELERLRFQDITPPDDLQSDVELASRLESGEIPRYQLEKRYVRKDGAIVTIMLTASILRAPGGAALYYITQVEDITERKRAEDALKLSQARFAGIIEISADAIVAIDEAQRITLFNHGAERIFGYSRAEALGAPLDLLLPDRVQAIHRRHVAGFAAGPVSSRRMQERPEAAIVGRRKTGEEFAAEAAISKLHVGSETVLTVALRDVSARKRVEEEQRVLAEAGALLGSSLDYGKTLPALAQLVVRDLADWCIVEVTAEDGRPTLLNVAGRDPTPAAARIEQERTALDQAGTQRGGPALDVGRPLILGRATPDDFDSLAPGPEGKRLLGALAPRSLVAAPLRTPNGIVGAFVLVSSAPSRPCGLGDLRLVQALADRAALAVENGRLYRTAVQATQLRDQVLAVVAHDLRNPLSAIRMQAATMERKGELPERRTQKPRERILRAADRMNHLIQDLLDVSVIEGRHLTVEPEPIAPDQVLRDVVEAQRAIAAASSLELTVELAGGLPPVLADRHRLFQILENLIGNAVKFTPPGGRITVGAVPGPQEVVFSVADTGCGIGREEIPHVFDRFWQARRGGRTGAGLGLPITRGIVEAHGGRIWVESAVGHGSTFFFAIPVVETARPMGGASSVRTPN